MKHYMHKMMFWRWHRRLECHFDIDCCQYVDKSDCNPYGAVRKG